MRKDIIGVVVGAVIIVFTLMYIDLKKSENGYVKRLSRIMLKLRSESEAMQSIIEDNQSPRRKITNNNDKYLTGYLPYLRGLYQTPSGCFDPENTTWTHNFTKPLATCQTTLPRYTKEERATKTRRQLRISCDGTKASGSYETVPIDAKVTTISDNSSRECLHHYINQHCYDQYPMPNVVHWVRYGSDHIDSLWKLLSFYSIFTILKPCLVLIHGSHPHTDKFWDVVMPFGENVIFLPREPQLYTKSGARIRQIPNSADIARLEAIQEFGGIYLDTDVVIFKPVDILRATKFSAYGVGTSGDPGLSNAVLFAVKDHDFTRQWLKHWETYDGKSWGSHSVDYITVEGKKNLRDVQAMGQLFHHFGWRIPSTERVYFQNCKLFDAFGQHLFHYNFPSASSTYDLQYIKSSKTTYGRIARYIIFNDAKLC